MDTRQGILPPASGYGGRLELSVIKANLRKETAGIKFRIRENPTAVLEAFEEISGRQLIEEPNHFFVAFEYGVIPDELRDFIETEPSDLLRVEMRKAVENIIYETLLDAEYHADTLRNMQVPALLARLRAECVPWTFSKRLPQLDPTMLCDLFEELLVMIHFGSRSNSTTVYDVQPILTHSLPTEVGDRKEFDHVFKLYVADWPHGPATNACFTTTAHVSVDNIPLIIAKTYKVTEGSNQPDKLLGLSSIPTPQLLDHGSPFRGFWRTINTPLVYRVVKTDTKREIDEEYESVADMVALNRPVDNDIGKKLIFTSLWRMLEYFYEDGCNPMRVLGALLDCLKTRGDSQNLPNGYTISVHHGSSEPFFGEIFIKSLFIIPEGQRQFSTHTHLQSISDWQKFHNTRWRVPFDMHGGRLLPSLYDMNISTREGVSATGRVDFEIKDYLDIRRMESYTCLLDEHSLLKWKTFLTGEVAGQAAILGGNEQWLACETVYETSSEDVLWGSNWIHAVNFHFGKNLPRFLVEVWVGEEFSGEYLLPELPELAVTNQDRALWPLVMDASKSIDGVSRKDYRKQTAPTEVKGWLWIETRWKLTQPRAGRLAFKIREARNISTKSVREDEVMPGAPQAIVWMYDRGTKEWSRVLNFTPFQYALYFLKAGQADRIMRNLWKWDSETLGREEPNWFNYFSWDSPGSLCCEDREIPVAITGSVPLVRTLRFHAFETRYQSVCPMLWTLCKNGVPSLMRPYIWSELSGGQLLKHKLDNWAQGEFDIEISAYEYICDKARSIDAPVFHLLNEDLEVLAAAHGMDAGHKEMLNEVFRAFTLFTAPPTASDLADRETPRIKFDQSGARMGVPIVYTSRMLLIAYFLSLDFATIRVTEEELFYMLLSLFSTRKSARYGLPAAPFSSYYTNSATEPRAILPTEMAGNVADALLLNTVVRWLHPDDYHQIHSSGISLEALFAPYFSSLFAGLLPSQSLYRLWDMAFNVIWVPPEVIDVDITYDEVENLIGLQKGKSTTSSVLTTTCVQAPALQAERDDSEEYRGSGVRAHKILFEGSMGRRILFAFAYSFVLQMIKALPSHPTALEVRHSISVVGAELRDPSEVVRFVERGDFLLFTSRRRINQIYRVFKAEADEKMRQLKLHQEQNKFIDRVLNPRNLQNVPTNFVLRFDNDPTVGRAKKVSGLSCEDPGLSTRELRNLIYPTLKHHALYCHPDVRKVASNTQGRVVVNVNRVKFLNGPPNKKIQLCVCFDKLWQAHPVAAKVSTEVFTPTEGGGVFVFNIDHPPPYTLKVAVKDDSGNVISKLGKTFPIRKLTTQGTPCRFIGSELFEPPTIELYLQWAIFVPTTEMFLPELGGRGLVGNESLRPGSGSWGDVGVYDPLFVSVDRKHLEIERERALLSAEDADIDTATVKMVKFAPLDRPRSFSGFNKIVLEGIIQFAMPNLLHSTEEMVVVFGRVKDSTNFQQMLNTNVSMREFITTLVLNSTGGVLDKITLLFDLYAHHEPEKVSIQESTGESEFLGSNSLYYHPIITPDAQSPASYKQIAMLKRIEVAACASDAMLPDDALPSLVADSRVRMNAISMSACAALLGQLLPRFSVHMNTLEMIQHACHTFDPFGRVPRVLSACLVCGETPEAKSIASGLTASRNVLCGCGPKPEWDLLASLGTATFDVSREVIEWVAKSTAETGWYGLNFFRSFALDQIGIVDPWPEAEKKLTVLLTPTGDLADVHLVHIDVDGDGFLTNGYGGNYIEIHGRPHAVHMTNAGAYSLRRDDIFFVEGSRGLLSACYAFDLHTLVIDKFQFIMSFLANPLLTDPLRRASVFARNFVPQTPVSIHSSLNVKFSANFYDRKLPLTFENHQPQQRKRQPQIADAKTLILVDEPSSPSTLAPSSPTNEDRLALNTLENPRAFEKSPIHASEPPAGSDGADVLVTVKGARNLKDVELIGEIDPYCLVKYGTSENRTKVIKNGGVNVTWEDTFVFKVNRVHTVLSFHVFDSEKIGGDEEIGWVSLDFRSLMSQSRFMATLSLPLRYKDTDEGELDVQLSFTGRVDQVVERKIRGMECGMIDDGGERKKRKTRGIELTIIRGTNLRDTETFGKIDPYVHVLAGPQEFQTKTINNSGPDAEWAETFRWNGDVNAEDIKFVVMDDDVFKDDVVGEGSMKLGALSSKTEHTVTVDLLHKGNPAGQLHCRVKVQKAAVEDYNDLDWEHGTIKIVIQKCENLPTAMTPILNAYCLVDCDGQQEKTCICEGDAAGDVHWSTSFHYSAEPWPRRPLTFEVVAQNAPEEDISLGACLIDLNEAKSAWKENDCQGVPYKLKLDGFGRATGSTLYCNIDFVAPPKNIQHLSYVRIEIDSVRDIPEPQGLVGIRLGTQEMFTALAKRSTEEGVIDYHQSFDFSYAGDQTISFEFLPDDYTSVGCCAFDLWSPLRQGKRSIRGDLWLMSLNETIIGKLRLGITFLESPPLPWPDMVLVDIKDVCSGRLMPRPQKLSVRNAKTFGETRDLTATRMSKLQNRNSLDEDDGKSSSAIGVGRDFHVGRTFGVVYSGQPSLWVDLMVSPREVWSSDIQIKKVEEPSGLRETAFVCNGMEMGTLTYELRFQKRPAMVDRCKFVKLSLIALNKLNTQVKPDPPSKAWISIAVDQVNSVKTGIYAVTESTKLHDNWVLPYRGQPLFRLSVHDDDGETISTADVNLWELMEASEDQRVGIQLYQNNAQRGGKIYFKADFICPPDDVSTPKLLRVGFRNGNDIGGTLLPSWRDLDPEVRVRSGANFITPPKTKNRLDPLWGDWSSVVKLDSANSIVSVELWDKNRQELVGSTNLHIWDVFRDPYAEWAGPLNIKRGNQYVGTVNLAMRLQIPQRVPVLFNTPGPDHPPLHVVRVFASDTPRDFRRKFIAACREIADMEDTFLTEEQKLLYECANLTGSEKAAYVEVDGKRIVLSDRTCFETVFPEIVNHKSPIKLHIVNVIKPKTRKSGNRALDRQREALRFESARGRINDMQSELSEDPSNSTGSSLQADDGFTYYPLGESTIPGAATIRRKECARDMLKIGNVGANDQLVGVLSARGTIVEPDDLVRALAKRTFEFHPDSEAPLGALGYAMLPLTDITRLLSQFKIKGCFNRMHQWSPVILHNFNTESFLLSRVAPFESVVGYDYPDFGRTYTLPGKDVLPAFADDDLNRTGARLNLYQDPGADRASRFVSVGAAPWLPPPIPRTLSAISDDGKRSHRDPAKSPRRRQAPVIIETTSRSSRSSRRS